eukprot:NODE_574_length_1536_cov_108.625420_g419_i0.p1 GENE.NODE_574_length_1536_cov_108.625420_g419_i0~~NODE_574_length_1536_cov_108.625420_g419_i0.p1  ORF type:complete len:440 (+),score=96.12 NODE_574_length_1536_cov_108.625420_g419_i0:54-1373(+)
MYYPAFQQQIPQQVITSPAYVAPSVSVTGTRAVPEYSYAAPAYAPVYAPTAYTPYTPNYAPVNAYPAVGAPLASFPTRAPRAPKLARGIVKGDVRMFSGCKDSQTSADVQNVASFNVPVGPGGAGGACTSSLMKTFHEKGDQLTWLQILSSMRQILQQQGYTQIPQLSSSKHVDLKSKFEIDSHGGGKKRALMVGINYKGQAGELAGCVNDVLTMQQWIKSKGYNDIRVMVDDPRVSAEMPTYQNILTGFQWLVQGAAPGDSLFLHYSGHGGQMRDDNGDEHDGQDETVVPVDYKTAGQMRDDVVHNALVVPLPEGVQLTVIMDCCHSGTILDLPHKFEANAGNLAAAETPAPSAVVPFGGFQQQPFFNQPQFAMPQQQFMVQPQYGYGGMSAHPGFQVPVYQQPQQFAYQQYVQQPQYVQQHQFVQQPQYVQSFGGFY